VAAVGVAAREGEAAAPAVAGASGGVRSMNAEDVAVGMELEALVGRVWIPAEVVSRCTSLGDMIWFTVSVYGGLQYVACAASELRPREGAAAELRRRLDENLRAVFD